MTYNLSNFTSATNPLELIIAGDEITGGLLILGLLGALLVIITVSLLNEGLLIALGIGGFVVSLAGILLIVAGVLSATFLSFFIIPLAILIIGGFVRKSYSS